MATQTGTITGVSLLRANGSRKSYLVTADFPAYTGASDDAKLAGVGAAIAAKTRNGKTNTLRSGVCVGQGLDTNAQAVLFEGGAVAALTVSSDDLTGNLTTVADAEITSSTASTGVELCVTVDES